MVRTNILPMKNVKRVIGEVSNEEYNNYTKPKIPTDGLEIGTIATIQKGAFKGEQGIVLSKTHLLVFLVLCSYYILHY